MKLRTFLTTNSFPVIFILAIVAMALVLLITYKLASAKKKTGLNFVYMFAGGIIIGLIGISSRFMHNPFYFYMFILYWSLIAGAAHIYFSDRILGWTATEPIGWRALYALAVVCTGAVSLLVFMQMFGDSFMVEYNLSALLTFFIPLSLMFAIECYQLIPTKVILQQKPWIYRKGQRLVFNPDEVSHFFLIKYRLTEQTGGRKIESFSMRAPGSMKLGDYFNSTLEDYKVIQDNYNVEVRDTSNNSLGWFFFLNDASSKGRMLDPNKTFIELGFSNPVYFGNSSPEEIEMITSQADRENKNYIIICKRELEYKSQLS